MLITNVYTKIYLLKKTFIKTFTSIKHLFLNKIDKYKFCFNSLHKPIILS